MLGEGGGATSFLAGIWLARRATQPTFMLENYSSYLLDAIKRVEKMVEEEDEERRFNGGV